MIDCHVHPDFSPDAQGSVREFCLQAQRIGLRGLCFTTHFEPDPARAELERVMVDGQPRPVNSDWPVAYFAAIEQARAEFPGLAVLAGIEVGYEPGLEGLIYDFLARYRFDFVLGAVHCLDHVAITAGDELDRFRGELLPCGGRHIALRYCRHVGAAAGSQLFDCLAHLDIYRKYVRPLLDESFDHAIAESMPDVFRQLVQSGTGLEVNSSALRRGSSQPYPEARLLRQASAAGVRIFTLGSDAHRPCDLGCGLSEASELLRKLGLATVHFRDRHPAGGE